jgi:acylphosphatase
MIRRRLRITGKVQGVFYRAWFAEQAETLSLFGWVRNRADGSVEAVVEGAAERIEEAIERARKGSPSSRVDDVQVNNDTSGERLDGFVTRRTL